MMVESASEPPYINLNEAVSIRHIMYTIDILSILELVWERTCAFSCHSDGAALGVVLTTLLNHSYTHKCTEEGNDK